MEDPPNWTELTGNSSTKFSQTRQVGFRPSRESQTSTTAASVSEVRFLWARWGHFGRCTAFPWRNRGLEGEGIAGSFSREVLWQLSLFGFSVSFLPHFESKKQPTGLVSQQPNIAISMSKSLYIRLIWSTPTHFPPRTWPNVDLKTLFRPFSKKDETKKTLLSSKRGLWCKLYRKHYGDLQTNIDSLLIPPVFTPSFDVVALLNWKKKKRKRVFCFVCFHPLSSPYSRSFCSSYSCSLVTLTPLLVHNAKEVCECGRFFPPFLSFCFRLGFGFGFPFSLPYSRWMLWKVRSMQSSECH